MANRRRSSGRVIAWLALSVAAWPLIAAQPPAFRTGVNLIAVDVQVVDKDGHPILDLLPANFAVSVGGKTRTVVSADLIRYDRRTVPLVATDRAPSVTPAAPPSAPEAAAGRYIMLAIDGLTFDVAASRGVANAAKNFVDHLQPDDRVGVFTFPLGPKMDPTTDRAAVDTALAQVTGQRNPETGEYTLGPSDIVDITAGESAPIQAICNLPPARPPTTRSPTSGELIDACKDTSCPGQVTCEAAKRALEAEAGATTSLGMLGSLLRNLGAVGGRKIVVLVSAGSVVSDRADGRPNLGSLPTELGRQAAQSDVTIYTLFIDESMLQSSMAENRHGLGARPNFGRDAQLLGRWLDLFSGSAGGALISDMVGSGEIGFDRILTETSAYYLLGVQPDEKDRDGVLHEIKVKVDRRGLTVRSRAWARIPKRAG